jgi:hypothetical protein
VSFFFMGSSCSNILPFRTRRPKTQAPPGDRTDSSPQDDLPSADEVPPSQDARDEDAPDDKDAPDDEDAPDDKDAASKYRRLARCPHLLFYSIKLRH